MRLLAVIFGLTISAWADGPVTDPSAFSPSSDRIAVLVSINEYGGKDPQKIETLLGPKNDMDALAAVMLEKYGFEGRNLLRLHGPNATREGILAALRTLQKVSRKDSVVVFAFAGHGYFQANTNEANARDETICPYDRHAKGDITDNELNRYFNEILVKGAHLTAIFDSCHSGSVHKNPKKRSRTANTPAPVKSPPRKTGEDERVLAVRFKHNFTFLAAADEDESAMEQLYPEDAPLAGQHGIFSHELIMAMREAPQDSTWENIFPKIMSAFDPNATPPQSPLALGNLRKAVFSGKEPLPEPHFIVNFTPYEATDIGLNVGQNGGLKVGDEILVYPYNAPHLLGNPDHLAVYRVTKSETRSAWAEYVSGEGKDKVRPGLPAIRGKAAENESPQAVYWRSLPKGLANILEQLVENHPGLIKGGPNEAHEPRDFNISMSNSEAELQLTLDGPGFSHTLKVDPKNPYKAYDLATDMIVNTTHRQWVLEMKPPNHLDLKVAEQITITVERQDRDEETGQFIWHTIEALQGVGPISYHLNKESSVRFSYALKSKESSPVFVTLLYLSNDGSIFHLNADDFKDPVSTKVISSKHVDLKSPYGTDHLKVILSVKQPFDPSALVFNAHAASITDTPPPRGKGIGKVAGRKGYDPWDSMEIPLYTSDPPEPEPPLQNADRTEEDQ